MEFSKGLITNVSRVILVFVVTLLLFLHTGKFDFVHYDDQEYVVYNNHMRDGLTRENVKWAFFNEGYAENWHPLAWTSLMFDVSVVKTFRSGAPFAEDEFLKSGNYVARVMHLHNVALHAANAALLMILMLVVCRGRVNTIWLVLFALFWSLHPLRTEVVCWVSERKELVSVFWMLLSLVFYFSRRSYFLALFFAMLAMMAKPVAVTLPAVIFAWDWIFDGRPRWRHVLPFVVMSIATCALTMRAQTGAIENGSDLPITSRLSAIFGSPLIYIGQTVFPSGLSMHYGNTDDTLHVALYVAGGTLLIVIMVLIAIRWLKKRERIAGIGAFAVAWLYVGLIPMLGIIKVGSQEHSDRYTYWIGCGGTVCLSLFAVWLKERLPTLLERLKGELPPWRTCRQYLLAMLCVVVAAYGVAAFWRSQYWRETRILFRDAIPKCWNVDVANGLALYLVASGDRNGRQEAEYWLRGCATKCPNPYTYLKLAAFLVSLPVDTKMEQFSGAPAYAEAEMMLRQVLSAEPENKKAKELLDTIEEFRKKH